MSAAAGTRHHRYPLGAQKRPVFAPGDICRETLAAKADTAASPAPTDQAERNSRR